MVHERAPSQLTFRSGCTAHAPHSGQYTQLRLVPATTINKRLKFRTRFNIHFFVTENQIEILQLLVTFFLSAVRLFTHFRIRSPSSSEVGAK